GGRRPVVAEPAGLLLEGAGDRGVQTCRRVRVDKLEAGLVRSERAVEVIRGDLAVPACRTVMHRALGGVARRGEKLGLLQRILHRLDIPMRIGDEFWNPPAFDAAVRKKGGELDEAA